MKAGTISDNDPRFLNLAGVLHEAHGRTASARNFYGKALSADASYQPARHNLKRLEQLELSGATRMDVAMGDEPVPKDDAGGLSSADRFRFILHEGFKSA
jgi:hypothetical protein